ncbi:MAG TPA: hypothetical protein VLG47_03500 [Candidatus Saccharimonadales bacterium]|nr:hypothetical protein [Candidatus Saccharimonadales bacterium]
MLDETNDAYDIYINLISSSAGHYISRRPHLIGLVKELLSNITLRGARIVIEQDMGRGIGTSDIVATSDTDIIYYAQPLKSEVYSRFAKNRYPQSSSLLTVVVARDSDGNYEVCDAWVGSKHPAFPGDQHATAESKEYWKTHALVHDAQVVQSKTITKTCPY